MSAEGAFRSEVGSDAGPTVAPVVGTVGELLIRAAWASPDTVAVRAAEGSLTYGELLERARIGAQGLRDLGCGPGTAVAVQRPNGPSWLIAHWAATLNRNVVVPVSPFAPAAEVERLLGRSRATVLWSDAEPRLVGAETSSPTPILDGDPTSADAIHVVQFTSGSTGEPKGAMLCHRGLVAAARHQAKAWDLAPGEAIFVPNPFCHVLGLVHGVLMPVAARATVVTMPRFEVDAALDLVTESGVVGMTGAPTHFQMLAERVEDRGDELPALRLGFTGGAPMAPPWVVRVRRALGLEALVNGYGMSEVGSVAHTRRDDAPEQVFSSVGFLVPGLEGRIVDPKTRRDLDDGEAGELWLRGPSVLRGYLDDAERTREVLVEGGDGGPWLRTGDLMRRDAEGRLSFVGRLDDRIVVGGFNVYPAEVERALLENPEVAQAAVVGRRHDRLGSVPVAFVRRRAEAEPGDPGVDGVLDHCRERLSGYRMPRHVELVDELPTNRSGKVDRQRLAELAEAIDVD